MSRFNLYEFVKNAKIRPQRDRLWKPSEVDTVPCLLRGKLEFMDVDLLVLTAVVYIVGSIETFICFTYLFHIVLACIFFARNVNQIGRT